MPNCPDGHEMMEIGPGIGWCGCCTNHFAFKENTTTTAATSDAATAIITHRKIPPAGYERGSDAMKIHDHQPWFHNQGRHRKAAKTIISTTITDDEGYECFKRIVEPSQPSGGSLVKVRWRGWSPCCGSKIHNWMKVEQGKGYWFHRSCPNVPCGKKRWLILLSYDGQRVTELWYEQ